MSTPLNSTHRVLEVLGSSLDVAFLGHRSALPEPEDAETHAVSLVVSELRSVIEDNDVGRHVSMPVLQLWVDEAVRQHRPFGELIDANKRLTSSQVTTMLTSGLGTTKGIEKVHAGSISKKHLTERVKPHASKIFAKTEEEAASSDSEFAHQMLLRTLYSQPPRRLELGTIVKDDSGYRICVQPACDSVRLSGVRSFPFLRLDISEIAAKANFVVHGTPADEWIRLLLLSNPRDISMIDFDPGTRSVIEAADVDNQYVFTDVTGSQYAWVGVLKPDFAMKVAVDLGQQFSQVAVDESELLRLSRR